MERHVPYWITWHASHLNPNHAGLPDLPTLEGWKAELTLVVGYCGTVVVVVVNGSYSAAAYSSPGRECITKSQNQTSSKHIEKSEFWVCA